MPKGIKQIDTAGGLLLITDVDPDSDHYWLITTPEGWQVLLRDDGCRIHSIFVSENPINPPQGQRDWELLWEYKHTDAPGVRAAVALIMGYDESCKAS